MKKIAILCISAIFIIFIGVYCSADNEIVIRTEGGKSDTASIGDTVIVEFNAADEYELIWYSDGEIYDENVDSLTVTTDMLGKSLYAVLITGEDRFRSNTMNISAEAPTIDLSGSPGDYSAILNWSVIENGSTVTHYDISYAPELTPDAIIDTVTLEGNVSSYTVDGLLGGTSYIIRLTAYNEAGSTSASVKITPNDPDLAVVTAVKNEIESQSITIHMNLANTAAAVKKYLTSYFSKFKDYGVKIEDITVSNFKAARAKTADDIKAEPGSFKYIVEISKGNVRLTTSSLSAVIDNSTSIVYLTSDGYSVLTGEKLTVTANKVDINSNAFSWYRASGENEEGEQIEGAEGQVYSADTSKADEYYLYCVCGGIASERVKITISEPFVPVREITLSSTSFTAGESMILRAVVSPANAAKTNIVWTVTDDGGCGAMIVGRTMTAARAGTVKIRAVIAGGVGASDFVKDFTVTVKEKEIVTEDPTDPEMTEYTAEYNADKIENVDSVTITSENGEVQITALSDVTLEKILNGCNLDPLEVKTTAAVKFVYEEGALAENVKITLTDKTEKTYKLITVNNNGTLSITEQRSENGVISVNTVSPDVVVIISDGAPDDPHFVLMMLLLILIPLVTAGAAAGLYYFNKYKKKTH